MKILVVEDEPLIRLGMVSLVEELGHPVLDVADADAAIRLIETDPEVRVIITDVDMPGSMDGVRLAHFVRRRWPPIRLIVISGQIGVSAAQLPAEALFFAKPYRDDALLAAVRGMAGGERGT